MKNIFSPPKLLRLGLIFSSTLCTEAPAFEINNALANGPGMLFPSQMSQDSSQRTVKTRKASRNQKAADLLLAQNDSTPATNDENDDQKTVLINFNNISIIEYIRFISRIINKNFVFDENDLQFNVTIVSEEPATLENIMTALIQELRIHDLTLLEQGNNLIIHRNPKVNAISQLVSDESPLTNPNAEIITQVFRLNTAVPEQVAAVIKPLTSEYALVEILPRTNHVIITDLATNIHQIAKLIKTVDSPASGLIIGQYVVKSSSAEALIDMARQLITPIAQDQTFLMLPWQGATSIYIVSTPYLVNRAITILKQIDENDRQTKILDMKNLDETSAESASRLGRQSLLPGKGQEADIRSTLSPGHWGRNSAGDWVFPLGKDSETLTQPIKGGTSRAPAGRWKLDKNGNWYFEPGVSVGPEQTSPTGQWIYDPVHGWTYVLDKSESKEVRRFTRKMQENTKIPLGAKQRTFFSIYKLQYRRGDNIRMALQAIASSLVTSIEPGHERLLQTLSSVQWLESSNSLIFTGYQEDLLKMRELMAEVDLPLRQVFIEMLVLETSISDSLEYGVTWGTRFSNGNWAGGQHFRESLSPLSASLAQTGLAPNLGSAVANGLLNRDGFNLGVIGQTIVNTACGGIEFNSISALLHALQTKTDVDIILSPKIITEDNVPAEIFVGENVSFKTQSITNDNSNFITNNFEYRDVGTRLRVTPSIGNNDIISLEIAQEISRIIPSTIPTGANAGNAPGPSTTKSTTTTRVHLPDGYFLIISGMMNNEKDRLATQVPCLGSLPILGGFFKDKTYRTERRNQMIFLRPKIIDTEEEIQQLTKHEQDIWDYENRNKRDWIESVEDAFEFLNLKRPLDEADPEIADRGF